MLKMFLDNLKWDTVRRNLVMPFLSRLGTMAATYLVVVLGADADLARQVAAGIVALVLIGFDFVISWANRKEAEQRGADKAGGFK